MKLQPRYKPGDRIGGRYQVHKALMGGMGEVYLCLDLEEMQPYALKTFQQRYLTDAQRLRRAFEQEVATWVALEKHPNIVRCFWMQILDNQPFMCLEWIAGEESKGTDLRSWLRRGPLDLKLALEVAIDICQGLMHAQAKRPGLVHRDLKPENILLAQGGLAKITDFGLAEIAKTAGLEVDATDAASDGRQSFVGGKGIVGTPAYMAPEQWRGEPLDERTDIYAVGIILYEMLIGACPFRVDFTPTTPASFQAWLRTMQGAHERGLVVPFSAALPAVLSDLLQRCLAKAKAERYATLADLVAQLIDIYDAYVGSTPPFRSEAGEFTAGDYNNRGTTYHALGQYKLALTDFGRAIDIDCNYTKAYSNRGNTYFALGQHEAALADYSYAIDLDPTYTKAYVNRGNTYEAFGQYSAALADYACAIALDPNLAQAYYNRGGTHHVLGQYAAALTDYSRAIELDPKDARIYSNRGVTYAALGQHAAALADYTCAIRLDPNDTKVCINRGNTYAALGQHAAALADYSRAIELDPSNAKAYTYRGNVYAELAQYELALADYSRAFEFDSNDAKIYFNQGALLANLGQLREALPYLEKAVQLGLHQGIHVLAQVRQRLGLEPAPQGAPAQQAFDVFQQADSAEAMRQAVVRFPLLVQADFMVAIEQVIAQQVPREQRPAIEQRLVWLRQIANTQNPRRTP